MRRVAASSITSGDRCAAPVTIIKEGTTKKCYLSPEYNLLPITWTVQLTDAQPVSLALQLTTGPAEPQSRLDRATAKATAPEGSDQRTPSPDSSAPSPRVSNYPHTSGRRAPADHDPGNGDRPAQDHGRENSR